MLTAQGCQLDSITPNPLPLRQKTDGALTHHTQNRLKAQGVQQDVITSNTLLSISAQGGDARSAPPPRLTNVYHLPVCQHKNRRLTRLPNLEPSLFVLRIGQRKLHFWRI